MSKSKARGTAFESQIVRWLNAVFDTDEFTRLPLKGRFDVGDVGWLRRSGRKVVIEAKNCQRLELAKWLREAEEERGNADALAKAVFVKRRGVGDATFGETYVVMEARDLYALVTGEELED